MLKRILVWFGVGVFLFLAAAFVDGVFIRH